MGHGEEQPDQLLANPQNWRVHPKAQQEALAGVLDQVGWVQDVIVNRRTSHVVDGHLRVALAISRQEATVPVVYVDLAEEEERLVLASLDPLAAMAGADKEVLAGLLAGLTIDNETLAGELAKVAGLPAKGGLTDPDAVPDVPEEPVTKLGDLWILGDHRLLCGDAMKHDNYVRLMDGEMAGAVFTSPPYDQQRTYEGSMAESWVMLMTFVADELQEAVDPGGQIFVNLGLIHREGRVVRYWDSLIAAMENRQWPLFGWYVWDKLNGMPGDWQGRLAPAHEWVFHFAKSHERPTKVVVSKTAGVARGRSQREPDGRLKAFTGSGQPVQPFKIPDSVVRCSPASVDGHPAPFPVALPSTFIEAWPIERWFDPFLGSGTTLIACEQLGRRCFAMDLVPRYVDVAVRRWEEYTGRKAERA